MSILLDAVTRNKQQQLSPLPDAVLTPRTNYPESRKASIPLVKLSLLALAVAIGVGVAWGVSVLEQSEKSLSVMAGLATPIKQNAPAANLSPVNPPQTASATEVTESQIVDANSSGVRLAGKVALPRIQELPQVGNMQAGQVLAVTTGYVNNPQRDPSYDDYLATSAQVDANTRTIQQLNTDESNVLNQFEQPEYQEMPEQEPIILGANPNRQGLAQLEALRQQVSAAAVDVGLETNQSREDDKLVSTFQDALKKVEYGNSAKTPVTQPKLDPIPKQESDDIPKYGQLPAGLQLQVPEFNIVAHVYSTDPNKRWLSVDGAELQEGDKISGKLTIISIRPRDVVLEIQGTQFKVPAI